MVWQLIALPIICALLGALGGSDYAGTSVRKYGIPTAVSLLLWNWFGLLFWIPLMLGYGESSWLRKLLKGSNTWTRITLSIAFTILIYIMSHSLYSLLFIPWYVSLATFIKVDNIEFGGLLMEEMLIYGGLGVLVCL